MEGTQTEKKCCLLVQNVSGAWVLFSDKFAETLVMFSWSHARLRGLRIRSLTLGVCQGLQYTSNPVHLCSALNLSYLTTTHTFWRQSPLLSFRFCELRPKLREALKLYTSSGEDPMRSFRFGDTRCAMQSLFCTQFSRALFSIQRVERRRITFIDQRAAHPDETFRLSLIDKLGVVRPKRSCSRVLFVDHGSGPAGSHPRTAVFISDKSAFPGS